MQLAPVLAVAAGSAIGGAARYLVAVALASRSAAFPLGTLVVNVAGGMVLGALVGALRPPGAGGEGTATWLFLTVGLCGGFTTFSAFGLDVVRLLQGGYATRATLYVMASVGLTVLAVHAGFVAGRLVWRAA